MIKKGNKKNIVFSSAWYSIG